MKCDYCNQEMTGNPKSCTWNKSVEYPDGQILSSISVSEQDGIHSRGICLSIC